MQDVLHALGFIAIFGIVFLSLIYWEFSYWRGKGRADKYNFKESLSNISMGAMYKVVDGIAIALFIQFFYDEIRSIGLGYSPELSVASVIIFFIALEFFYYWYHFAMHKVRWMWSVHVSHHSSKQLNLSTALRQNFLLDLNFGWVLWWGPLALIGFDKDWAIIGIELSLVYQFFLHTEVVDRIGKFEWVLNTPSHHRVHHGCKPDQIDTNFGGILIIWDRLFGTFRDERDVGELEYGLTSRQPTTLNPLRLNLDEFFQMLKDVVRYKDLKILYKPPAYVEEKYSG